MKNISLHLLEILFACVFTMAISFLAYAISWAYDNYTDAGKAQIEKTRLEIEKLKYELSIYKENEERLK